MKVYRAVQQVDGGRHAARHAVRRSGPPGGLRDARAHEIHDAFDDRDIVLEGDLVASRSVQQVLPPDAASGPWVDTGRERVRHVDDATARATQPHEIEDRQDAVRVAYDMASPMDGGGRHVPELSACHDRVGMMQSSAGAEFAPRRAAEEMHRFRGAWSRAGGDERRVPRLTALLRHRLTTMWEIGEPSHESCCPAGGLIHSRPGPKNRTNRCRRRRILPKRSPILRDDSRSKGSRRVRAGSADTKRASRLS